MKINDFINSPELEEAFGKKRIREVINHMETLWPGFPKGEQQCNPFITAWLIFILAKCRNYTKLDVGRAIRDGAELRSGNKLFNVWFGELLCDELAITRIKNIFIFQSDNLVNVTPCVESGNTETLLFQGKKRACSVDRAAILTSEFLQDIHLMLIPIIDESLESDKIFE